ncbi:MAG: MlaE family ABC transporter permease [Opitutales bacterium]
MSRLWTTLIAFLRPPLDGMAYVLETIGGAIVLFFRAMYWLPALPRQFPRFVDYAFEMSVATLPIVALLSVFIGAVLALQTGEGLNQLASGANDIMGGIVGLSLARELGPVMTAFLLAGRVGSATTAELASMKVYSEIDALRTMNIPPERILIMPRLVAVALVMPLLALISIFSGWLGGALTATTISFIGISPERYWNSLEELVTIHEVIDGMIKAEAFGLLVMTIVCAEGLRTSGGPREIGAAVTRAVVWSMVAILLSDYFITRLLI